MKILLIQPPIRDFYHTPIRTQPIGLAYLASSLKREVIDVEILDCQTARKESIPIPSDLFYLKDFYPFEDRSPFKLYTGYYHFGMSWEEISQKIRDSKADIFGISSSFTPYHGEALEIARIIKTWDRRKIVIMGGAHVSCDPFDVLQSPWVDFVVLGEGEIRLPLLLEQIGRKGKGSIKEIDGVGCRQDGEIKINPLQTFIQDLDSLPPPDRELLDPDQYQIHKKRSTMIITSRGCPHGCAYCSAHLVMGTRFRIRSPEAILKEMIECRDQYHIQAFDIEDDNFTFDPVRAKRVMALMIQQLGEGKIELSAMNGISFASLDRELLNLMKSAGFHTINLSFVSIDPGTRDSMRRPKGISDFDHILREAEQVGLQVIAYAIFGMPGQTIGEMVDTLIYLMGKRVLIGPSVYYPTPGTPLFEKCKTDVILPAQPSQWRSSAFPIVTEEFGRPDLVTLFRLARLINFVKRKMDREELEEGMTWKELFKRLKDQEGKEGWMDLILLLINERNFYSIQRAQGKLSLIRVKSSGKVLDYFLKKALENPILRSRSD